MDLFISVQAELFSCPVLGIAPTGTVCVCSGYTVHFSWSSYLCPVSVQIDTLPAQWYFGHFCWGWAVQPSCTGYGSDYICNSMCVLKLDCSVFNSQCSVLCSSLTVQCSTPSVRFCAQAWLFSVQLPVFGSVGSVLKLDCSVFNSQCSVLCSSLTVQCSTPSVRLCYRLCSVSVQ